MPAWVEHAYQDYAKRLPPHCRLVLKEIPAQKRTANADLVKIKHLESQALLDQLPPHCLTIALDESGELFSTKTLATQLAKWQQDGRDIALLIGGPEGLTQTVRDHADLIWSLSPLTFPHPLVRVILAEQWYRACSLLAGHPYHRE